MINSPVLDTAIGLVFIFLLYSLLTTSVKEAIATLFGFRARMLKKGIVEGMLSNSKREKWILDGTLKAIWSPLKELSYLIVGYRPKEKASLGQKFYDHPIIKNYGSNDRFSKPSYIPKENFSTILIEVLKEYYEKHKNGIVDFVKANYKESIDFEKASGITKIYYLIKYLQSIDNEKLNEEFKKNGIHIDKETVDVLALHLEKSYQNLTAFEANLETWFDDSMNRVSGWYKRQVQFILFFLGFAIAVMFNVDIIDIAGKLSTDKDARDKLVQIAIKESEQLKDDPRVKKLDEKITNLKNIVNTNDSIKSQIEKDSVELANLKAKFNKDKNYAKDLLDGRIKEANNLLAIGWGDYGMKRDSAVIVNDYECELQPLLKDARKNLKLKPEDIKDSARIYIRTAMLALYDKHWIRFKVGYVLDSSRRGKKALGFLLLGFGVCLGAPFWFDLLQKLIKIRSSGKKENGDANQTESATQPVQVTVNNNNNPEAVG